MNAEIKQRVIELCDQADHESDPARFHDLVHEANRLMDQKENDHFHWELTSEMSSMHCR